MTRILSPRWFLLAALLLVLTFGVLHLAGLREYTSIVCGAAPTGDYGDIGAMGLGFVYIALYLAAVVLAPILVLAACISFGLKTLLLRRRSAPPENLVEHQAGSDAEIQ